MGEHNQNDSRQLLVVIIENIDCKLIMLAANALALTKVHLEALHGF